MQDNVVRQLTFKSFIYKFHREKRVKSSKSLVLSTGWYVAVRTSLMDAADHRVRYLCKGLWV